MKDKIMEQFNHEISSKTEVSILEIGNSIRDWSHGNIKKALELYDKYGIEIFRKLPERHWKIKSNGIKLYRGIRSQELENGPVMLAGRDEEKKIQRLTSWTWDKGFAQKWAGQDGLVLQMMAHDDDIAFAPLAASPHRYEREVVVADYHLKKDRVELIDNEDSSDRDQNKYA